MVVQDRMDLVELLDCRVLLVPPEHVDLMAKTPVMDSQVSDADLLNRDIILIH